MYNKEGCSKIKSWTQMALSLFFYSGQSFVSEADRSRILEERIINDYLLVSLSPFSLVISAFQLGLRRWHFYQLHLVLSFDF
jgi:hypothetical protein